ncbi:hypothetical protein C8R47DRAFT_1326735 [Mycena vitilis]|nr:hypothetical protein C8R47DRAFT_1326735 [Mycena vitilis]
MAALPPTPSWPRIIDSQATLLRYLISHRTPALHDCWYTADFFPPSEQAGSDNTAYTDGQGTPVSVIAFGSLLHKVTVHDGEKICTIRVALKACEELKGLFIDQAARLMDPIRDDGISDIILDKDPHIEPWCSPIRFGASGGTINVNVSETDVHIPSEHGELLSSTPRDVADFGLKVGDWILVQATMHKVYTLEGPGLRTYVLRAHHVRRLDFDAAGRVLVGNAATLNESSSDVASSQTLSSKSPSPAPAGDASQSAPKGAVPLTSPDSSSGTVYTRPPASSGATPAQASSSSRHTSPSLAGTRTRKRKPSTTADQERPSQLRRSERHMEGTGQAEGVLSSVENVAG